MKRSIRLVSILCLLVLFACFSVGCGMIPADYPSRFGDKTTELPLSFGDGTYTYTKNGETVICLSTVADNPGRLEGYYLKGTKKIEVFVFLDQECQFRVYYDGAADENFDEWYLYRCNGDELILYNGTSHSGTDCWFARFGEKISMTLHRAESATEAETQS